MQYRKPFKATLWNSALSFQKFFHNWLMLIFLRRNAVLVFKNLSILQKEK